MYGLYKINGKLLYAIKVKNTLITEEGEHRIKSTDKVDLIEKKELKKRGSLYHYYELFLSGTKIPRI